tara:strand:+ start:4976 stop:5758 length:783 start_codon:yes stop_codon:yes gene_type:complete
MKFKILAVSVFSILAGCQAIPKDDVPNTIIINPQNAQTIELLVPKSSEIKQINGTSVNLTYGSLTSRNKYNEVWGHEVADSGQSMTVAKIKGANRKIGKVIYSINKEVLEEQDNLKVELTPLRIDRKIPFDLMQWSYDPGEFSQTEMAKVLKNPSFKITFEVNNDFSVDSTVSNFKRLGQPVQQYNPPVKEVGGNISKQYFQLQGQKVNYIVGIEVFPYRDGSKAVIDSWINPIELDNGVITLKPVIDELKTIVNNIISN